MKSVLLTFDLEECDILRKYKKTTKEEEMSISKQGLLSLLKLLEKYNLKATFFTTAEFAKFYPNLVKSMKDRGHEIAYHGYSHSDSYLNESDFERIPEAKKQIEQIISSKILGFRAPRFEIKQISKLNNFGFYYDSSTHPTFIPGKYINLSSKRTIHKISNLIEIPLSVLPFVRLSISWIFFKTFPLSYAKSFAKINFLFSDYLMLLFHPWEFANLSNLPLPSFIKRKNNKKLLKMLEKYIIFCTKNKYVFRKVSEYLNLFPEIN